MIMKKFILLIFIMFKFLLPLPKISVDLKLIKTKIFKDMPVYINVKFHNISKENFKFVLYENLFYHFDFRAKNDKNIDVNKNINYSVWKIKNENISKDYDKIITLGYNDSFIIKIDLTKWLDFNKSGYYFVSGDFIANPMLDVTNRIIFNTTSISFYIKPSEEDIVSGFLDEKTVINSKIIENKKEVSSEIPPYIVMKNFIISEKDRTWDSYFKYINLDNYLKNSYFSTSLSERYKYADAKERELLLEEFKEFLKDIIDYDIQKYKIIETKIIDNKAEIIVYSEEKVYKEKFIKKFNSKTQQIEIKWITDPANTFIRKKTTKYVLLKGKDKWLVNDKLIITTE